MYHGRPEAREDPMPSVPDHESGAVATEYALVLALIALVVTATVAAFGSALSDLWSVFCGAFPGC
jgi:pilus assembly protein Flp/PilA